MSTAWTQAEYDVAFEWGATGAARIRRPGCVLIVVDVLSFSTSVSVAVERGTVVYPAAWGDERAIALTNELDAQLAVGRGDVTPTSPWSLSPAALRSARVTPRLVLPSPNGSAISSVAGDATVAAACFRNAAAVGAWAAAELPSHERVCVIAAGERWPDGSLRPALEDALGAGAVIKAIAASAMTRLSPEAEATRGMYAATSDLHSLVSDCSSARELRASGYGDDVEIALERDRSDAVPVIADGGFSALTN